MEIFEDLHTLIDGGETPTGDQVTSPHEHDLYTAFGSSPTSKLCVWNDGPYDVQLNIDITGTYEASTKTIRAGEYFETAKGVKRIKFTRINGDTVIRYYAEK